MLTPPQLKAVERVEGWLSTNGEGGRGGLSGGRGDVGGGSGGGGGGGGGGGRAEAVEGGRRRSVFIFKEIHAMSWIYEKLEELGSFSIDALEGYLKCKGLLCKLSLALQN